jgi:16S rRNA (adenine1518-N6/adenine1519-N6)-dimethyltransferase
VESGTDLRSNLRQRGFAPLKRYGQHFLVDSAVVDRIVAAILNGQAGARVVEVGPGTGVLTQPLLKAGATVLALEIDRGLAQDLARTLGGPHFAVEVGDALRLDWNALYEAHFGVGAYTLAGNLPYYITGPLIARLWDASGPRFDRAVFMLQREAADRLIAEPGQSGAGSPSVLLRTVGTVGRLFDIPPDAFFPRPRVWSTVVEITARRDRPAESLALWSEVVHAAFAQRRKMLRTTLARLGHTADWWSARLQAAGIAPTRRAETLTMVEWSQVVRIEDARRKGGAPDVV